jgi:hypothetical protein
MNSNQNKLYQPSGTTRFTSPATGHPDHPREPVHQIRPVNPLHTLNDSSMAHTRPHLYSSCSFPIRVPLSSPKISSSASTPSHTTATSSRAPSVRIPSTRYSSLKPPPTCPFHVQSSSIPPLRDDTGSVPSKRVCDHAPGPSTFCRASPISSYSERPAKRSRVGMGPPSIAPNHRGTQPPVFSRPPHPCQCSGLDPSSSGPRPRHKKAPLHPLAVDYSRPVRPVVPQPPFFPTSSRQNRIPPPPDPKNPDLKRSLDDELRGPVDQAVPEELMWMQKKRMRDDREGYSNPSLGLSTPASLPDNRSSSCHEGEVPAQSGPEMIALYGPASRNNESIHPGENLHHGTVQRSTFSMGLELAVGGNARLMGVSWKAASSLEVSIGHGSGGPQGTRIRTLAEYRQVVKAEKVVSAAISRENFSVDTKWSYSSCEYTAGRVVNSQKACKQSRWQSAPSTSADRPYRR